MDKYTEISNETITKEDARHRAFLDALLRGEHPLEAIVHLVSVNTENCCV